MRIPVYFAPMEGVTDNTFRRVHAKCFPGVSKYFIPFVSPTYNLTLQPKEWRAVAPENNQGITAVPQIMVKQPDLIVWILRELSEMGWTEVNLNAGCPSGTVTAKGKGAGLLTDRCALERLLDAAFENCPVKLSVKTRIGFSVPDEWEDLLQIYAQYPFSEVIVHPRTRQQFYGEVPYTECYRMAMERLSCSVVWNGDVFTERAGEKVMELFPETAAIMAGRGQVTNPALARELNGGEALTREELIRFAAELEECYTKELPPVPALGRMREIMLHIICCFEEEDKKIRKALCKARRMDEFMLAVGDMMALPMKKQPEFVPPEGKKSAR